MSARRPHCTVHTHFHRCMRTVHIHILRASMRHTHTSCVGQTCLVASAVASHPPHTCHRAGHWQHRPCSHAFMRAHTHPTLLTPAIGQATGSAIHACTSACRVQRQLLIVRVDLRHTRQRHACTHGCAPVAAECASTCTTKPLLTYTHMCLRVCVCACVRLCPGACV